MRAAYARASRRRGPRGLAPSGRRGLRVVAVDPPYVRTALDDTDQRDSDYTRADIARRTPMGRYAEPAKVASVVAFLAPTPPRSSPAARSRSRRRRPRRLVERRAAADYGRD